MKKKIAALSLTLVCAPAAFAQSTNLPAPTPTPDATTTSGNASVNPKQTAVSRENRELAYVKFLEGQRLMWLMSRRRQPSEAANRARLAKEAFRAAVALDPSLAEAYTALAELALNAPPNNIEEAIGLANAAVKINPNNFGARVLLARLYTVKSGFNRDNPSDNFTARAIAGWREIARLDGRNAEAFAFLSELYAKTNQAAERIDALQKWLAASVPLETGFYRSVMGGAADLSPESAALKLGEAFFDAGRSREAVEILSRTIADNPEDFRALELLGQAIESADTDSAVFARQALTQAVYANPENVGLIALLARVETRAGNDDGAAKILRDFSAKLAPKDGAAAANLQVALGDNFAERGRFGEAAAAYENALTVRGIGEAAFVEDAQRDFAIRVFEKIIQTYKKSNRTTDAEKLIARARTLFGAQDLFPDRLLIKFYRETGRFPDALRVIKGLRARNADDYALLRLEANVLTDSGKVDQAVALIKPLIGKKSGTNRPQTAESNDGGTFINGAPQFDDFTNYIFISNLYAGAKRGREAVEAANQALSSSRADEEKQIAQLTLATAYQTAGNFAASENILRALLKQTPGNPIALNNLGYFLIERDANLAEALQLIERAVKIDPTNPSYLDSLGWTFYKLQKFDLAEKYLKDAARFDDSSATIFEHLGDVYQKQNKIEAAKSAWQKSIDLSVEAEQISRLKAKIKTAK